MTSGGASSVVLGDEPADPTWRLMTVPVSAQAAMNGSQWPECSVGRPWGAGDSGKVTEVNPRSAFSLIISAPTVGSRSQGI